MSNTESDTNKIKEIKEIVNNEPIELNNKEIVVIYKYYKSPSVKETQKRYAENHPEKIKEIRQRYYQKNKERILEKQHEYLNKKKNT